MTYEHFFLILRKSHPLNPADNVEIVAKDLWTNPGKSLSVAVQYLNSSDYRYLVFDYKAFGFEYIQGKVTCTGIELLFKKEGYDKLHVNVFYDPATLHIYNSCLLSPAFNLENYKGKKSFSQIANTVRNDKDFERYVKRINKRFNLN